MPEASCSALCITQHLDFNYLGLFMTGDYHLADALTGLYGLRFST